MLINTDALTFLSQNAEKFNLVYTSPPYNFGMPYEEKLSLDAYLGEFMPIFRACVDSLADDGSMVLQLGMGNFGGETVPLDYVLVPELVKFCKFKQRIIWHYKTGVGNVTNKFVNAHECLLWFSKTNKPYFDLDAVRVPQIDRNKRKNGRLTGNPLGKNPSNVWLVEDDVTSDVIHNIPQVQSSSCEAFFWDGKKHPCQTPCGLAQRMILALCPVGGVVYDPFAGVGSIGLAAQKTGRKFMGTEKNPEYVLAGNTRLKENGAIRPHDAKILEFPRK